MTERQNRTFICSVLFLDIVEYSRKPVAEQIRLKDRFNALLSDALQGVAPGDRIILDTGDGAAISFLGDPEDALFAAFALRDALAGKPATAGEPKLSMRVGINLGPVKLVRDLNGQPNIIGDGINVAQRIMSFSTPGQVLVSRSYYEVVSCLSDEYSQLFHYEGARTDKHVREHEVYAVGVPSPALRQLAASSGAHGTTTAGGASVLDRLAQTTTLATNGLRRRPRLSAALATVAILAAAVALRIHREAPESAAPAAVPAAKPAAQAVQQEKKAAPSTEEKSVRSGAADAGKPATVSFAITPWGEIYVDGKKHGVSPPLREVEVAPGRHRIEIRNTTFPSRVETIDAGPGARIRIKHKFR